MLTIVGLRVLFGYQEPQLRTAWTLRIRVAVEGFQDSQGMPSHIKVQRFKFEGFMVLRLGMWLRGSKREDLNVEFVSGLRGSGKGQA